MALTNPWRRSATGHAFLLVCQWSVLISNARSPRLLNTRSRTGGFLAVGRSISTRLLAIKEEACA